MSNKKVIFKNKKSLKTDTKELLEASIFDRTAEKEKARRLELSHLVTSLKKAISKAEEAGNLELVELLTARLNKILDILEGKEEEDEARPATKGSTGEDDEDLGEDDGGPGEDDGKPGKPGGPGTGTGKGKGQGQGSSRDPFVYRRKRYSIMGIPLPSGGIPGPGEPSDYELMRDILKELTGDAKEGALKALEDAISIKTESLDPADAFIFRRQDKWLTEAILKEGRKLGAWSDDEFNDLLDSTLDLIDKALPIKRPSEEEEKNRLKDLEIDITNKSNIDDIEMEDKSNIRKDPTKGNREEAKRLTVQKYEKFSDLQISIYRAIKDQVELYEEEEETWTALDRRHEDDPAIVVPGHRLEDKEKETKPNIYCYVDCSGSWGESDILMGKKLLATLAEFVRRGELDMEIWYHSNIFTQDYNAARSQGWIENFDACLDHIQKVGAKNVLILADHDIEWSTSSRGKAKRLVVPGCVWWCWKDGSTAKDCILTVKGKRLNAHYSFKGAK